MDATRQSRISHRCTECLGIIARRMSRARGVRDVDDCVQSFLALLWRDGNWSVPSDRGCGESRSRLIWKALAVGCLCAACIGALCQPAPTRAVPTLPPRCTLTFEITVTDVSTEAMRRFALEYSRDSRRWLANRGVVSRESAEAAAREAAAGPGRQQPPRRLNAVLSLFDGKTYYRLLEGTYEQEFLCCDTYSIKRVTHAGHSSGGVMCYPQHGAWAGEVVPMPGAGLPSLPLITPESLEQTGKAVLIQGRSPAMNTSGGNEWSLRSARAEGLQTAAGLAIARCLLLGRNNELDQRWDFSGHRVFQGVMLASRAVLTDFGTRWSNDKPIREPTRTFTFMLLAASPEPLP